jgi:hypothetical protein
MSQDILEIATTDIGLIGTVFFKPSDIRRKCRIRMP